MIQVFTAFNVEEIRLTKTKDKNKQKETYYSIARGASRARAIVEGVCAAKVPKVPTLIKESVGL